MNMGKCIAKEHMVCLKASPVGVGEKGGLIENGDNSVTCIAHNVLINILPIALCYIYVVMVVYIGVVARCSRKLRCVVNSWYHRV